MKPPPTNFNWESGTGMVQWSPHTQSQRKIEHVAAIVKSVNAPDFFVLLTTCSSAASVPQPTQKAITVEVPTAAPTNTVAPTTTAPVTTTTVAPTASAAPAGLSAICTLDSEHLRISCRATGHEEGSHLTWTSTASWAYGGGSQWEFTIDEELLGLQARVLLEECQGSACQTVDTSVDTSAFFSPVPTVVGLTVTCTVDDQTPRISCQAGGYQEGSQLGWTSDTSDAHGGGSQWEFTIDEELLGLQARVLLEECQGSACQTVDTSVDTSAFLIAEVDSSALSEWELWELELEKRRAGREAAMNEACMRGFSGSGPVMFANSPMRLEDIGGILPYGLVEGSHVTPIDHMYFSPKDWSLGRDAYEVRAIQDGVIFELQARDIFTDTNTPKPREWRMEIVHSCTFTSYFDLLTSIHPDLESVWSVTGQLPSGGIPVSAGQLVGWVGAQTLDFGVYDWEIVLPGFVEPSHYDAEPWKIHTVDPFPYFPAEIRDALLTKVERKVEPRAGKIDYDIDGRLVGNWFEQGTRWYWGAPDNWRLWDGHLAIVPDAIDPTLWWFSIGNYEGVAAQLRLLGEQLDPREVSAETGAVTYLLTARDPGTRDGVALVEMTGPRTVKVEVLPGLVAADVMGFTGTAKIYER
jgi:hypothetical protein